MVGWKRTGEQQRQTGKSQEMVLHSHLMGSDRSLGLKACKEEVELVELGNETHTIVGPGGHGTLTTSSGQALCPAETRSPGAQRWQTSCSMESVLSQGQRLLILLVWLLGGGRPDSRRTRVAPWGKAFRGCGLLWRRGARSRGRGVSAGPKRASAPDGGVAAQG